MGSKKLLYSVQLGSAHTEAFFTRALQSESGFRSVWLVVESWMLRGDWGRELLVLLLGVDDYATYRLDSICR